MNSALSLFRFAFTFFIILGCISGSDIYPSIHWFPHNPVFQADGINCGQGPRELTVQLQSKTHFVCPNIATVLQTSSNAVLPSEMYENLWLVYNKTAFDECDVSLDPNKRRVLTCNEPQKLTYSLIKFEEDTAELDGITFDGGRTYYFIATSDGTKSGVNNTSGGRCRNNNMKIEVYVCKRSNQTYQDPDCTTGVGKLICPPATSGTPPPSTVSPTRSTEGISATRSIHPSASVTPSKTVCVQTVITKTVSSEVTGSVSCPDMCDKHVSSADPCERCSSLSTQSSRSSVSPTEHNQSIEPQHSQRSGLSGSQDDCSGKETWQAFAALFIVLFCVVTVIAVIQSIKYRKSCFGSCHRRVGPLNEKYGTEMGSSDKPEADSSS